MKNSFKKALVCTGLAMGVFGLNNGAYAEVVNNVELSTGIAAYTVNFDPASVQNPETWYPVNNLTAIVDPQGSFPANAYAPPAHTLTVQSQWISAPQVDANGNVTNPDTPGYGQYGTYTFTVSFYLPTDTILSTAAISGIWSADNLGTTITLNAGTSSQENVAYTPMPGSGTDNAFKQISSTFSYPVGANPSGTGFIAGAVNTLTFTVDNTTRNGSPNFQYGNPVSLDSLVSVTFDTPLFAVPEPSSLALLGLGGIGLVARAIRRRKVTA